jgi:predicted O-methyltransferase YrrM
MNLKKINKLLIESTDSKTDLCELGIKYPTDKSPYNNENKTTRTIGLRHRHPYTAVYDLIFSPLRYKNIKILEIGILESLSIKCWREYFPNAELFGFEFDNNFLELGKSLNLKNTTYEYIDVKVSESIENTLSRHGKYDIIIEDSTHKFEDQIRVCKVAHKYLNTGGILVVEDVFRSTDEDEYLKSLEDIIEYYSTATFVVTEHELRHSPGWDNDKLLILIRNDK